MEKLGFDELAGYLRKGREIEFSYQGRRYSITNHSGRWHLCDDTEHILLETICRFEEKEDLVARAAVFMIDGMTIRQIFDRQLFDADRLYIL